MTEEPEDRHPNDAEAERLHGRDAPALVQPADLCPPVGWWQGRGSSRTTPEGLTETTTFRVPDPGAAIAAAVEARASLLANPRREPPKLIIGQAIAFLTMHGLPLPQEVVEALATAMSLNRRVPERSFADVAEAIAAARQAVAVLPVPRRARAVVLQVARWFAERGDVLPDAVFDAVIVALGLSDGRGALRQKVMEKIAPSPLPGPRVGMRKPDQFKAAVEFEARQRLGFATEEDEDGELDWGCDEDPTRQETPARALAGRSASVNTIRAWVASTAYQMAVYSRVFWRSKLSRQWRWRRDDR